MGGGLCYDDGVYECCGEDEELVEAEVVDGVSASAWPGLLAVEGLVRTTVEEQGRRERSTCLLVCGDYLTLALHLKASLVLVLVFAQTECRRHDERDLFKSSILHGHEQIKRCIRTYQLHLYIEHLALKIIWFQK